MGCFFSIFKFGSYALKEPDNAITDSQTNLKATPEIRKHSSTPLADTPKQRHTIEPLLASKKPNKDIIPTKEKEKEKPLYKTTFETQVDAAPPHPLEEKFQDIQLDEIEIDTNLFTPEVEDAVVKIQAGVRGYLARKQVKEIHRFNSRTQEEDNSPLVPPPINFVDLKAKPTETIETLSPLSDLAQWKKLSQHLEEKIIDGVDNEITEQIAEKTNKEQTFNNKLIENVIPLKDSNDNKVIETYVCKENILDVEAVEERTGEHSVTNKVELLKTSSEKVIERVFNVLVSETDYEDIVNFVESNKTKNESPIVTTDSDNLDKTTELSDSRETPESKVLAKLNEILDTNESTVDSIQSLAEEYIKPTEEQNQTISETKVLDTVSENTTQNVIKNSIQEFIQKELIHNQTTTTSAPNVSVESTESNVNTNNIIQSFEQKIEDKIEETIREKVGETIVEKVEEQIGDKIGTKIVETIDEKVREKIEEKIGEKVEQKSDEKVLEKVEEKKTDSMIFEEQVVQTIFDETEAQKLNSNQVFAIELFKNDINEQQLANVTTITEPEEKKQNIEDRVYKTSVDEFVVKPVEPQKPIEPSIALREVERSSEQAIPILETEQKIEIMTVSTGSRKGSVDIIGSNDEPNEEPVVQTLEVLPSPTIQIEEQNGNILDEEEAAIRIQAAFRGYQIRRSMSREASPNRSTNHNNTDNNNNNPNDNTNEELISNQINSDLLIAFNPSEQYLTTNELPNDSNIGLMSASNEQINSSLEILENQLMQELIEDENRTETEVDDNIQTTQQLLEDIELNTSDLTAPLLLQRLQQSAVDVMEESRVQQQEETALVLNDTQVVEQTFPETIAIEIQSTPDNENLPQNTSEEQNNTNLLLNTEEVVIEDKPLIQKSDTIIDLLSSSPQRNNSLNEEISFETNSIDIENNNRNNSNINELNNSEILFIESQTPQNLTELSDTVQELESNSDKAQDSSEPVLIETQEPVVQTSVEQTIPSEETISLIKESKENSDIQESIQTTHELESKPELIETPEPIVETKDELQTTAENFITDIIEESKQILEILESKPEIIETPEPIETKQLELIVVTQPEPVVIETNVEPPTPDIKEITPELAFIQASQQPVLTKVYSSESEQEIDVNIGHKTIEIRPSLIPVLESNNKNKTGEQALSKKMPKPILKEKESQIPTNLIPEEQTHSTSEEISSPDDDNPEFVGLGPNTPIPIRASSPNPFGKKRRRGKKPGGRKN